MLRLRDRWVILLDSLGAELLGRTVDHHMTTDPACVEYRATRSGSRLDRVSRGHSCGRCMADAAFGRTPDHSNGDEPSRAGSRPGPTTAHDSPRRDETPDHAIHAWRDRHGDIWTEGDDGLMYSFETAPFPREHVERKWGPLTPLPDHMVGSDA